MYSKKVMKYFTNPKNMGEIKDADGIGKVGNPVCGDVMYIYIKVGDKKTSSGTKKIIKDIKVKTFGCVAAIATSSITTEMAKGKTLEDAKKITKNEVVKKLGGLPPIKTHCSNLALDALNAAIDDYYKRNKGKKK